MTCFETQVEDENAALEFTAHIGDIELKVLHLIRFNTAGKFAEEMVRSVKGVKALGNAMASFDCRRCEVENKSSQR